jgi:hypothetical protein
LSHLTSKITNTLFIFLSDKYASGASGEASLDICEFVSQMILELGPLVQCPTDMISRVSRFSTFFCIFKRNIAEICARSSKSMDNAKKYFFGSLASSAEVMIF